MKKFIAHLVFILFFIIGYFWSIQDDDNLYRLKRSQFILGTIVEIQIEDEDQEILESSINSAFDEIKRIDSLFSTYNSGSEVSIINNKRDTVSDIHSEVFKIILISNDIWKKTNGAFDAGLNNLIKVWGFDSTPHKPSDKKIEEGINKSGWDNIKLKDNNSLVKKNNVQMNFGGIAKGYAVKKYGIELDDYRSD
jgi:thiamine biosynthesis lipoprotein